MFEDLSRHTLIRKHDGGVFLIKCKVYEIDGLGKRVCYLGHLYPDGMGGVDYYSTRCYTSQIDSIIKEI
jgi:hypothetical protein